MTEAAAPTHVEIEGRRWQATDPSIPEPLRRELVEVLMAARRDIGAALRTGEVEAEAVARRRVHLAEVALGERGARWWEPGGRPDDERIAAAIATLLDHRPGGTAGGEVVVRQRGEALDPSAPWQGPIRIAPAPVDGA